MADHTPPTDQQLDELETLAQNIPGGPWTVDDTRAELRGSHGNLLADLWDDRLGAYFAAMHEVALPLVAEVRRLRDRVTELETYAHGCDAEGHVLPHSSWCEAAKKTAADNDGCTCGRPWADHPQPHAMHCWTVNPPRAEVEEMRRALAAGRAQAWRDLADRADPQRPEISFFGDHGHEVGAWMRKQAEYEERATAAVSAVEAGE